jgi:hypothetical protein
MLPARPAPREELPQRALREAIEQSPNRFVGIEAILFDEQLGWMHEFAAAQQPPIREQLQLALGNDRPVRDFSAQVRQVPTLATAWNLARVRRAADHIARWGTDNGVVVEPWEPPPVPDVRHAPLMHTADPGSGQALGDVQRLRARFIRRSTRCRWRSWRQSGYRSDTGSESRGGRADPL